MKKRNILAHYFLLLVLIATFVACASTSKQSSTGEYFDDSVVMTNWDEDDSSNLALAGEGEVFGDEEVSNSRKIFSNVRIH